MALLRRSVLRVVLAAVGASLGYLAAVSCLDPRAALEGRRPRPPAAAVSARLASLGLSGPVPVRYARWAAGVARGDFGLTLDGGSATGELTRRAGVSLRLVLPGAALGTAGGMVLGAVGAVRRHGWCDRLLTASSFALASIPVFALAVLLQAAAQWTNARTGLRVFAWTGEYTPGSGAGVGDRLRHLLLPTATIAAGQFVVCARYQRGSLLEALDAGYVRTAMAKGLPRRRALLRHGLRVAVIPMPGFATYGFASLLTGAAITEKTFAWHGLGEWLIDALAAGDVNAVAACTCAAAVAISCAGLLSDLCHTALDPRIRP
jgi:peptide/nickel transport system permease protein